MDHLHSILFSWASHVRSWTAATHLRGHRCGMRTCWADAAGQLDRILCFLSLEGTTDESQLRRDTDFSNFVRLKQSEKQDRFSERRACTPSFVPERRESGADARRSSRRCRSCTSRGDQVGLRVSSTQDTAGNIRQSPHNPVWKRRAGSRTEWRH